MDLEEKTVNGVLIVKILASRFVANEALHFGNTLAEFAQNNQFLVVDLSNVKFMDSFGVGSLLGGFRLFEEKGEMALCGPSKSISKLLAMTGVNMLVRIFPDAETAILRLGQTS